MANLVPEDSGDGVLGRLIQATNAHDIDAIVACFAPAYRNDTPAHPARSFTGRDQVRRTWEQILEHDTIAWARFYLEPVQTEGGDVAHAVRAQVAPQRS